MGHNDPSLKTETDGPRYECESCDLVFRGRSGLFDHKQLHRAVNYTCDICEENFQLKDDFNKHRGGKIICNHFK